LGIRGGETPASSVLRREATLTLFQGESIVLAGRLPLGVSPMKRRLGTHLDDEPGVLSFPSPHRSSRESVRSRPVCNCKLRSAIRSKRGVPRGQALPACQLRRLSGSESFCKRKSVTAFASRPKWDAQALNMQGYVATGCRAGDQA